MINQLLIPQQINIESCIYQDFRILEESKIIEAEKEEHKTRFR